MAFSPPPFCLIAAIADDAYATLIFRLMLYFSDARVTA